jgi:mRNA interferase MazF
MVFHQRDLVLLPYPFSDKRGTKIRPALIVSNDFFNNRSNDFVMLPLTTIIKEQPFSFIIDQNDLESGTLIQRSRIRIDRLFSLQKDKIIMKIGVLNDTLFRKIKFEIIKIF